MTANISALPDALSISSAWTAAAKHLRSQKGRHCYNLIYCITKPDQISDGDRKLYERYHAFAAECGIGSTTTVANTIFPLDTYIKFGSEDFYDRYALDIFPQVKTAWGTYFDRMIRRKDSNGKVLLDKTGTPINPLSMLVGKLCARVMSNHGSRSHYELAIADEEFELTTYLPEKDSGHQRGGPCLSHVSFKIDDAGALRLSAFYRSHYYLQRAMGNLLGLARLQAFVATEAGLSVGPLTCIASYAFLESNIEDAPSSAVAQFFADAGLAP